MVLTFRFCQGIPRKSIYEGLEHHPRDGALRLRNSQALNACVCNWACLHVVINI